MNEVCRLPLIAGRPSRNYREFSSSKRVVTVRGGSRACAATMQRAKEAVSAALSAAVGEVRVGCSTSQRRRRPACAAY